MRPTLDRSAELGELLAEAKTVVPYGDWTAWLKRVGLNERTARTHCQVFRHIEDRPTTAGLTIEQFLAYLRQSRIAGRRADRDAARAEAAVRVGRMPDGIALHHADCRTWNWPRCQAIISDPPWADMECYHWLGRMAADRLHDGGVMLLQCGTGYMAKVLAIMTAAGLTYSWCLSMVYEEARRAKPTGVRFLPAWVPVLLLSKGPLARGDYVGDVYTVRKPRETKSMHNWSQPVEPIRHWAERLIPPGSLVLDPFAGSGTTGSVCRSLGLRWIGTEVDRTAYEVARGRLLAEVAEPAPAEA